MPAEVDNASGPATTVRVAVVGLRLRLTEHTSLIPTTGPEGEVGQIEISLDAALDLIHALHQAIPAMMKMREAKNMPLPDLSQRIPAPALHGFDIALGEDLVSARLLLRSEDRIATQFSLSTKDLQAVRVKISEVLTIAANARKAARSRQS